MLTRRTSVHRVTTIGAAALAVLATACGPQDHTGNPGPETYGTASESLSTAASLFPSTFVREWFTNIAFCIQGDGITPPAASRSDGYAGVAAWEAVVHGIPGARSLAGQLNGLDSLPLPSTSATYDWPTVLAATMGTVVPGTYIFPNTLFFEYTTATHVALGSLERIQVEQRRVAGVPESVLQASTDYGHTLGQAIVDWANTDGYADKRYEGYIPPVGPDKWIATGYADAQTTRPIEPHFGEVRPIALVSATDCGHAPRIAFSTDPSSEWYAQANTVYQTDIHQTKEQREIALFWMDGPGSEMPPNHWTKLTGDLVRPVDLATAVRAYLLVGVSLFDAGIATWNVKFHYNTLRPETYIHRYIAPQWISLIPAPQFPSYTSGHSGFSAAAATALTSVFGEVPFTDRTKVRGGFEPRSFPNFMAAANEAAQSRLYGGIHYPMDNEDGEELGACVANTLLARALLTQ